MTFRGNGHFATHEFFVKNEWLDKGRKGGNEKEIASHPYFFQKRVDFAFIFRYNTGLYEIPA